MPVEALPLAKQAARGLKRAVAHRWRALTDARPKLLVLGYHRVWQQAAASPFGTVLGVETFTRQLEVVARRYAILPLAEAVAAAGPGASGRAPCVTLTFDDGSHDHHDIVLPLLRRLGVPATFFIPTGAIGTGRPTWDWELVSRLVRAPGVRRVPVGEGALMQGPAEPRGSFIRRVIRALKTAPEEVRRRALEVLREDTPDRGGAQEAQDRCLTWDEVRALRRGGMAIGSHAVSHRSLAHVPMAEAVEEIRGSKARIEQELEEACGGFAFPFGSRQDYTEALIGAVRDAGYTLCALNIHGYNHLDGELFALKRIIMLPTSNPATLLG